MIRDKKILLENAKRFGIIEESATGKSTAYFLAFMSKDDKLPIISTDEMYEKYLDYMNQKDVAPLSKDEFVKFRNSQSNYREGSTEMSRDTYAGYSFSKKEGIDTYEGYLKYTEGKPNFHPVLTKGQYAALKYRDSNK